MVEGCRSGSCYPGSYEDCYRRKEGSNYRPIITVQTFALGILARGRDSSASSGNHLQFNVRKDSAPRACLIHFVNPLSSSRPIFLYFKTSTSIDRNRLKFRPLFLFPAYRFHKYDVFLRFLAFEIVDFWLFRDTSVDIPEYIRIRTFLCYFNITS